MNAHTNVVAAVADTYRQRGYQVDVEPIGPTLPAFLSGFRPDLIARSANDNVVVEVKVGTQTAVADRLREVAERVNKQPGWRFSVVFADPNNPGRVVEGETTPLPVLERRLESAHQLIQTGQLEGAFLLLWSALEGALRLLGDRAQLPLTNLPSSALIRELYSQGELDRQQFEILMRELPLRNQLVHGLGSGAPAQPAQLATVAQALIADLKNHD